MGFKDVFFEKRDFRPDDNIFTLIKDGWIGILTAVIVGILAINLSGYIVISGKKYFDAFFLATTIGIIIRFIMSKTLDDTKFTFKISPGLYVAQLVLMPIGVIFYGANHFNVNEVIYVASTTPLAFVQLIILVSLVFISMYYIGKALKLPERFSLLLGFGSAVCGTAALAVTAPICKTDSDETSIALILNTLVTIVGFFFFTKVLFNFMDVKSFAEITGSVIFQTGFTKMILSVMGNPDMYAYGMALKALRIALLIISIPTVVYILRKKIFIPWYMVLFLIAGIIVSFSNFSAEVMGSFAKIYIYMFSMGLAAVGLNADITSVARNFWKPLGLVVATFAISIVSFFLLNLVL
ncbi:hypothetical protein C0585_08360 [Candidatus Woesearchaeota archaeon]|nr:MAG: hypothetical protein C0585_08360 [Candidatus Woesearchaeota archaeon]